MTKLSKSLQILDFQEMQSFLIIAFLFCSPYFLPMLFNIHALSFVFFCVFLQYLSVSLQSVAFSNQQHPSAFHCTTHTNVSTWHTMLASWTVCSIRCRLQGYSVSFIDHFSQNHKPHIVIQYVQDKMKFYEHSNMCKSNSPFECTLPAAFSWACVRSLIHTHTLTHSLTPVHFNYKATRLLNRRWFCCPHRRQCWQGADLRSDCFKMYCSSAQWCWLGRWSDQMKWM